MDYRERKRRRIVDEMGELCKKIDERQRAIAFKEQIRKETILSPQAECCIREEIDQDEHELLMMQSQYDDLRREHSAILSRENTSPEQVNSETSFSMDVRNIGANIVRMHTLVREINEKVNDLKHDHRNEHKEVDMGRIVHEKLRAYKLKEAEYQETKTRNRVLNIMNGVFTVLAALAMVVGWRFGAIGVAAILLFTATAIATYMVPRRSIHMAKAEMEIAKQEYDRTLYEQAQETLDSFGKESK